MVRALERELLGKYTDPTKRERRRIRRKEIEIEKTDVVGVRQLLATLFFNKREFRIAVFLCGMDHVTRIATTHIEYKARLYTATKQNTVSKPASKRFSVHIIENCSNSNNHNDILPQWFLRYS